MYSLQIYAIAVESMQTETKSILHHNRGRDPERLRLKLAMLRADPYAFFRGTAALFYETLVMSRSLGSSPLVLACGDLHLENFGSYKGDNRLVYFDLVDFDESCIAPVTFELVRLLTSILVAAKPLKMRDATTGKMIRQFLDHYAANVVARKPRWTERALATGPVKKLLHSLKGRHRRDLIKERTVSKSGERLLLTDGEKSLPISAKDRAHANSVLHAFAITQQLPAFFEPIDIARRIAGNGSLGLERYVALVRGDGSADGQYLIDIKYADPSALATRIGITQPRWKNDAERVVSIQRISQAIPPALLGFVKIRDRGYVIKELEPAADRVNLAALGGKSAALLDVVRTMAETVAWAHLRSCGRFGADSVEELADFIGRVQWRDTITRSASAAHSLVTQQWRNYSVDYDANPEGLISATQPG